MLAPQGLSDPLVLRLTGTFDIHEAERIRAMLTVHPGGAVVTLDFSAVREVHDLALATLFTALTASDVDHVEIRGLCNHHYTLLRYLGMPQAHANA
jgi:hypothetical protein